MDGSAIRSSWRGPATKQTWSIKNPWRGPLTPLTQTAMARLNWKKSSIDSATRITKTWRSWQWGKISGLNCSKSLTLQAKTAKSLSTSSSKTCLACSIVTQLFLKNKMNHQRKLHPFSKKKDEQSATGFKMRSRSSQAIDQKTFGESINQRNKIESTKETSNYSYSLTHSLTQSGLWLKFQFSHKTILNIKSNNLLILYY